EQRRAAQQRLSAARESVHRTERTRLLIHEVLRPQMALFVRGIRPRVPDLLDTGDEQLAPTALAGRFEEKQRRQRRPGRAHHELIRNMTDIAADAFGELVGASRGRRETPT